MSFVWETSNEPAIPKSILFSRANFLIIFNSVKLTISKIDPLSLLSVSIIIPENFPIMLREIFLINLKECLSVIMSTKISLSSKTGFFILLKLSVNCVKFAQVFPSAETPTLI